MSIPRSLLVTTLLLLPCPAAAQGARRPDPIAVQRLLEAEDARGTGRDGVRPIMEALSSRDPVLRRLAVRAAGRLQRPELGKALVPFLTDADVGVRREAANGIAQSLNRVQRGNGGPDTTDISVAAARTALAAQIALERDPTVIGALANSLGRLPYGGSVEARDAEAAILASVRGVADRELIQGLYRLAMTRRITGSLTHGAVLTLRHAVGASPEAPVRRLAIVTLALTAALDSTAVVTALADRDDQVRRHGLEGVAILSPVQRNAAISAGLRDPSSVVRIAAIAAVRAVSRTPRCAPILSFLDDPTPMVTVAAANALGSPCADSIAAFGALERVITVAPSTGALDHRWQRGASALQSLAKVAPTRAQLHLARYAASARVGERITAATVAGTLNDQPTLRRLATDPDHNVQEAAVTALSRTAKHAADSVYVAVLSSRGYQAVLAAATALAGTTRDDALEATIAALRRITTDQKETSRDPRMMLLSRIGELGNATHAGLLSSYLSDFDSTVAYATAEILTRWGGTTVRATPRPLPIRPEPLADILLGPEVQLLVTMAPSSGGGRFVIRLNTVEAPATAARLMRLAREGFYNGKIIQRVEPNFVTQGGGPDGSEYVGDGPFMRDELGLLSHFRGTIGISSRGRDTGDAQLFLNLVDNPRLDHEYTVAGDVIRGLDVAEGIMAGDIIGSVEVDGVGRPQVNINPSRLDRSNPIESIEQTSHGTASPVRVIAAFDGLGVGFVGPQGSATLRNPSDNSLAVGPDHIVQIVNSRMAIFTKAGKRFGETGQVLYGPVETRNLFRGFGGLCEQRNTGDAVARFDQLANRWLIVMPIFSRGPVRPDDIAARKDGGAGLSVIGRPGQPGGAVPLFLPELAAPNAPPAPPAARPTAPRDSGQYAMCYAVSTSDDPMGSYYRYEFVRPLFPDYPRPAVWPDAWYLPSSTGDDVIEKHTCAVDRARMLRGEPATEQCIVVPDVNFLNNVDLDGTQLPPKGAPNIVLAAGGTQLKGVLHDDGIYAWQFHVDWDDPSKTRLTGPEKIAVAPYDYLCGGQLTTCVPQPGVERRLDSQGDKLMARVVYRRIGKQESIVATHSIATAAGAGGVRWYEFRVGRDRAVTLYQQGTYAPDSHYRWLPSPAIDRLGNIGIGYSFGSATEFAGQRFAARRAKDPLGVLALAERILVDGEAAQTNTLRWEDYTQTAIDPVDDCTIWYVGDYYRSGATSYSSRIGAVRLPGCK